MKKIEMLGIGIIIIALCVILVFFRPVAFGGDTHYLIVLSGSMEPAIKTGDVVVVQPVDALSLQEGDIICFRKIADQNHKVTHRIYEVVEGGFRTKGDANEGPDTRIVRPDEIVGKMVFNIPYLGYIIHYAGTPLGFVLLVIIPAVLLIIGEIQNILKYYKEGGGGKNLDQK